jgi:hypothetical protein
MNFNSEIQNQNFFKLPKIQIYNESYDYFKYAKNQMKMGDLKL